MKQSILIASLGLALATSGGIALAQDTSAPVINADGTSGASNSGVNPNVDADGPTIVYGDLNPGPGNTVIAPPPGIPGAGENLTATSGDASALGAGNASAAPGTVTRDGVSGTALLGPDGTYNVTDVPTSTVTVGEAGAPAPVFEPVPEAVVDSGVAAEPVIDNSSVASATDLDGDNYDDALELEIGLDPSNPDTDGDGVADGDEVNIYGTDPYYWDSDGDGISDGVELFDIRTDPLVWNGDGAASEGTVELAVTEDAPLAEEAVATTLADDSDGDRLADADEAAIGTDPFVADTDGDGYYDGDEAALGSDPFDPGNFPAV